jgi:hypothetical protein
VHFTNPSTSLTLIRYSRLVYKFHNSPNTLAEFIVQSTILFPLGDPSIYEKNPTI